MNFKQVYTLLFLLLLPLFCTFNAYAQGRSNKNSVNTGDEFVGPFKSWLNAKTQFGAIGDGIADDTKALQAAFDAAAKADVNSTLYLPAGTYVITGTLTINYHLNVSIIGADPATTIIKWGGARHGTMVQIDGTAYSKFNRITFNGNSTADIAVDQSWDGGKPHFDTSNEYADDVFVDVGFGIHGGHLGHGFAETSILRDQFIRNTSAGISLGNFNALDVWVRSCLFQDCAIGVTNTLGAGNFRVYNCVFRHSTGCDMSMHNTGGFSVRDNTSTGSNQFFVALFTRNPAPTIIEGNTIIDPVDNRAVFIGNQGPIIFVNNTIRSPATSTKGPVVVFSCMHNSTAFCTGNTFTVANPVSADSAQMEYNDKVVPTSSLAALSEQTLPTAERNYHRKIFEVPADASTAAIQSIINQAATLPGKRPVIHFPFGNFNIDATLFIPASSDMQLVGDGYGNQAASTLTWTGTTPGPIISIACPGRVTLRDMTFKGSPAITNIRITNADQRGTRVLLQAYNQQGGQVGLLANRLDHTLVFAYDTQFSGLKTAISVIGGQLAAAGKPSEGRTIIYSGAESNNTLSHEVLNGGNLAVQDTWYEGGVKSTYASLNNNSIFTAAGDRIATPQHSPSIVFNNFWGKATLVADDYTGYLAINGNCSRGKILALGLMAEEDPVAADSLSALIDLRVLLGRARVYKPGGNRVGSYVISSAAKYDQQFINTMLSDMTTDKLLTGAELPTGAGDIRFYHVMSLGGAIGLDIEPGKN